MSWATYAEKQAIDKGGAAFDLEPGPEPSRGTITLLSADAQQLKVNQGSGESLIFYDKDGTPAEFKHIHVESIADAEAGLSTLALVDSRCSWNFRTGTWILNLAYDDNEKYNTQTTKSGQTPWSFKEIIQKFGTTLTTVPSGAFKPTINYSDKLDKITLVLKNINYECMPAAEAMQDCLSIVGGFISIDMNGNIWVCMPGDNAPTIDENSGTVSKKSRGDKANLALYKPQYLKLKYRILREKLFTNSYWEPVMQYPPVGPDGKSFTGDEDGRGAEWGTTKEVVEKLGYKEEEIKKNFYNLEKHFDVKNDKNKAAILSFIKSQYYKYFRYKTPTTTSEEAREQVLPFHDTLATFSRADSNEKHHCAAFAEKTKCLYSPQQDGQPALIKAYANPFCVRIEDQNQGIIHFDTSEPVCDYADAITNSGKLRSDFSLGVPDIRVWVAYIKKFVASTGLQDDYYVPTASGEASGSGYADKWSGSEATKETFEMLVEDVYYIEQNSGGGFSAINQTDIDSHSAKTAEDYFKGFRVNGRPEEITQFVYDKKITRLYADMRFIQYTVNTSEGGVVTFKYNDENPINPFSRNYLDDYGSLQGIGHSYRMGAKIGLKHSTKSVGAFGHVVTTTNPEQIKFLGLMGHCANYGKRSADSVVREPAGLINDWTKGLLVAEDWGNEGGEYSDNHRSKTCRTTGFQDEKIQYKHVAKTDDCYHHVRKMWETRLIAEENERGPAGAGMSKLEQEIINPTYPGATVQTSGGGVAPAQPASGTVDTSGGGISAPVPVAAPTAATPAGPAASAPTKGISTYVWKQSSERGPTDKGPLNNVLQVGSHRQTGIDPDGNFLCRLEIDLDEANHHCTDENCGPLSHIGKRKKPKPHGIENAVYMFYDEEQKKWDWYCLYDGGGGPPGPVPTPMPRPTPTPGTPVPGPGDPPPPPDGPVTTPQPGPTEGPAPVPTTGTPSGWGEDGNGPVVGPWDRKTPSESGNDPNYPDPPDFPPDTPDEFPPGEPPPDEPGGGWDLPGTGVRQECRAWNPDLAKNYPKKHKLKDFTGGSRAQITHPFIPVMRDYRRALPWFDEPHNVYDYEYTPGGSHCADPYIPGSQVHPSAVRPYERPSPYYPGTGSISLEVERRFDIAGQPVAADSDWADHSGDRITDGQFKLLPTMGDAHKAAIDKINSLSARMEDLYTNQIVNKNLGPPAGGTFITVDGKTVTYSAAGQITLVT